MICKCMDECMSAAMADGGHIEVLQWARSQDPSCPWNSEEASANATSNGLYDVVEWFRSQARYSSGL